MLHCAFFFHSHPGGCCLTRVVLTNRMLLMPDLKHCTCFILTALFRCESFDYQILLVASMSWSGALFGTIITHFLSVHQKAVYELRVGKGQSWGGREGLFSFWFYIIFHLCLWLGFVGVCGYLHQVSGEMRHHVVHFCNCISIYFITCCRGGRSPQIKAGVKTLRFPFVLQCGSKKPRGNLLSMQLYVGWC